MDNSKLRRMIKDRQKIHEKLVKRGINIELNTDAMLTFRFLERQLAPEVPSAIDLQRTREACADIILTESFMPSKKSKKSDIVKGYFPNMELPSLITKDITL
jgi:hypothetical protein